MGADLSLEGGVMKTVRELLEKKGREVWTVSPTQKVFEALQMMADKEVGALVVINDDKVVGIMSERDYARKIILKGASSKETPVREIMSTKVVYVRPEQTAEECLALMTEKRCRHLPVLENERLAGIVSIGDAVKAVIADRDFMIGQLENYIRGG
jgi:CBS domain-containing protein